MRRITVFALIALGLALCAGPAGAAQPGNPMAGEPFYVDSGHEVDRAEFAARAYGDERTANALDVIARTPQSTWFIAADDPGSSGYVHAFFARWSAHPETIATITLHGLPQQVCAGDNAPGHASAAAYRDWIDGWARLIGDGRVVVFLEPDALAASACLSAADRATRLSLMAYAARRLSALPHTGVYEDIGAADWTPLPRAVSLLRAAGVRYARGFALNATHYDWTADELAYGDQLARRLHGKHFVVNTAFNGRGPQVRGHGFHVWCNPRGRALGPVPTTRTRSRFADALYWIGNPGLSDGRCNGGPTVGAFWLPWALALVHNSTDAPDYPVARRSAG